MILDFRISIKSNGFCSFTCPVFLTRHFIISINDYDILANSVYSDLNSSRPLLNSYNAF